MLRAPVARKKVVVVEGEDASPEAVRPTLELVDRLDVDIDWVRPLVGGPALEQGLPAFSDEAKAAIDESDCTFFGATSGKTVPVLLYLRWGKATFANVRPTRWWPGYQSPLADPAGLDLVIVRENVEDLYVAAEGDVAALEPLGMKSAFSGESLIRYQPGKFAIKVITEEGSRRVARFAFELARRRKAEGHPGRLTCATKHNVLRQSDGLFKEQVDVLASEYPDVEYQSLIVDDFAHRLVKSSKQFDVIVTPNLYGDVLSDAAAGLAGGLGVAPSGCYGADYAYFESVHGTAPDIAGRNIINPTANLLSAALMLDYLGFAAPARRLEKAIERTYADGASLTPDQGGSGTTTSFCEAVAARL